MREKGREGGNFWFIEVLTHLKSDLKRLKGLENVFRSPVGSIERPRLVLDTMEVSTCVPRVPWYIFLLLRMQNYSLFSWFSPAGHVTPQNLLKDLYMSISWGLTVGKKKLVLKAVQCRLHTQLKTFNISGNNIFIGCW